MSEEAAEYTTSRMVYPLGSLYIKMSIPWNLRVTGCALLINKVIANHSTFSKR